MIVPQPTWESLPDFTLADMGINTLTPAVDTGWDIAGVRRNPERTEEILAKTNGVLCTYKHRMRFFINEIKVGIGMSGTWGQGRRVRDLYPQAFTMPQYTIVGQSLTQEDYGLLCEFIHAHQQEAMGNGNTIHLSVKEGIPIFPRHEFGGAGIAGYHEPIEAMGFVEQMPRKHERFIYTPTFEFEFNVVWSSVGIFSGQIFSKDTVQRSFMDILEAHEQPFGQTPKEVSTPSTPTVTQAEAETPEAFKQHNEAFGPSPEQPPKFFKLQ